MTSSESLRTRTQQMAQFVMECVQKRVNDRSGYVNYQKYAAKFPAMIANNGLAASLAFAKSKEQAWKDLYEDIQSWFISRNLIPSNDLLTSTIQTDFSRYRQWTREAMKLSEWFKRISKIIPSNPSSRGE